MSKDKRPLCQRLNNPGCIIRNETNGWLGKVTDPKLQQPQTGDLKKEEFVSAIWGWRAMRSLLVTYMRYYGLVTVADIIRRWSHTDQEAYIKNVSDWMGVSPDATLNMSHIPHLMVCVARQEGWPKDELPALDIAAACIIGAETMRVEHLAHQVEDYLP